MRFKEFKAVIVNTSVSEAKAEEEEKIKIRVIKALQKRQADDPIFDKVYKTIIGPALDNRLKNYIASRKDADFGAQEIAHLVKTIPQLGSTEEVKSFADKWNAGRNFINIDKLVPSSGMSTPIAITSVVEDGLPKALFNNLAKSYTEFSKSDAGPAEGALAMMSDQITYSKNGGDLIIQGKKIEIKSGGRNNKGGGRIINDSKPIDQSGMAAVLKKANYILTGKSISVLAGASSLDANFPKLEFIKACSIAFFGKIQPQLVSNFSTPNFISVWQKALFDDYKQAAGHEGILVIGTNTLQYLATSDQILTVKKMNQGVLYYPGVKQNPREFGVQVAIS